MTRTTRRIVADQAILCVLASGPLSTNEIADRIRTDACEAWSVRHGYGFEWFTDEEPLGARLLASTEARDRGLLLHAWEVYPRLRGMERRGEVARIQVAGHRPMLWRLP